MAVSITDFYLTFQWIFMAYFIGLTFGYLMLDIIAALHLRRYMEERYIDNLPQHNYTNFEPQISVLVPAFNEEATIASSIQSLLQLSYSEYEIIVVNDGSKDRTLDVLIKEFALVPFPDTYDRQIQTQAIKAIYRSRTHRNLRVIDKNNGGKADSLNAAINISRYPLFCSIDADSILQRDSLRLVVQPFLDDPRTIACGGTVRIANGCQVREGFLTSVGLPTKFLGLFQIVEYLRAFLFGRLGWSPLNAMLIISGAFGLFHKNTVVTIGGYRSNTIGEDMELVVRLHRHLRLQGTPYRITYVPNPVCWTEAPEDWRTLKNQRIRWQRGLCESLTANIDLLFHVKGGVVGWCSFPFMVLFEWLGPAIEVLGYMLLGIGFMMGFVSVEACISFLLVAISLGVLLSVSAVLLEELSFHIYSKPRHVWVLLIAAIAENFGYRQLNTVWRLVGLAKWGGGRTAQWGQMSRKASWRTS